MAIDGASGSTEAGPSRRLFVVGSAAVGLTVALSTALSVDSAVAYADADMLGVCPA